MERPYRLTFLVLLINEGSLKGQFIHIALFAFTVLNIFPYLSLGGESQTIKYSEGHYSSQ